MFHAIKKEVAMLKKNIEFHNMDHSSPLEEHANQKLQKVEELLKRNQVGTPQVLDLWLKANRQHHHHSVEIKLKTPMFSLEAHDESPDMYVALYNCIDKIVALLNKQKKKVIDKQHKAKTEKQKFAEGLDKYTLD